MCSKSRSPASARCALASLTNGNDDMANLVQNLAPVDRLEIHILVDNATDSLSSVPKHVETEFSYLHRKGMRILSGKCICCASHGLSCLIIAAAKATASYSIPGRK